MPLTRTISLVDALEVRSLAEVIKSRETRKDCLEQMMELHRLARSLH